VRIGAGPNTVGTTAARNVISGNGEVGLQIDGGSGTIVSNNYIGTSLAGTSAIGNGTGVSIDSASGNTIGTTTAGNLITGNNGLGISISSADDTIVRNNNVGLAADGDTGIGNAVHGIWVDNSTNVDIGGVNAGEGNVISFNGQDGIAMDTVTNSRIYGNTIGLNATGTAARGNAGMGVTVFQSTNVTVGTTGGGRNVISGNSFGGIAIPDGSGHTIENNLVGTNAAGTAAEGNLGIGIEIISSDNNTVRSNVLSGNDGHGIEVVFGSTGTIIHSNIIGLSADQSTALANGADGVNVCDGAANTTVGSVALGGNVISGNTENGIGVEPTALLGNTWAANSIYGNTLLGIDLLRDGATPNDGDDVDTGANNIQNFPTLVSAVTTGSASQIRGTINTTANTSITVHAYSSPTNEGEGQTYLGATTFTTDGSGNATWLINGTASTVGHFATTTATAPDGSSEFSGVQVVNAVPIVQFSAATYPVGEAGGFVTITVSRTGDLNAISTVQYTTSNGTADAGDYTTASGTLTFNPGDASETFNVPITNDTLDEATETINLTLSNPTMATLGAQSTAEVQITDDDPPPAISINDVPLAEGNSGTTNFVFTISIDAISGQQVQVNYTTNDGTAVAPDDYATTSGTATINAGSLSTTVTVPVIGDAVSEPNETFTVDLTVPVNATILDNQGLGTITNDEGALSITIDDPTMAEANNLVFTLTLSGPSATPVTVNYTTADGTATAPGDYTSTSGVATFAALSLTTQVTVPVNNDTALEPNETLFLDLSGASGATIGDTQGMGTITNDDVASSNLDVTKIANVSSFTPGQQITFTITVSNAGPDAAEGTTVVDILPAGTTLVSATPSQGSCSGTTTVTCNIGTLSSGANATVTLVVTASGTSNITNTASASSSSIDLVPDNNAGSVTINAASDVAIPTLSVWLLMLLGAALAFAAVRRVS
jgi:uncharacterized repeat protein (TIGR01451 family)